MKLTSEEVKQHEAILAMSRDASLPYRETPGDRKVGELRCFVTSRGPLDAASVFSRAILSLVLGSQVIYE